MLKRYILFILILISTSDYFAQQTTKERKLTSLKSSNSGTISNKPLDQPTVELSTEEQVAKINYHIQAIDNKVGIVKNNPEQHQTALKENWYEQMATTRKSLVAKRELLLNKSSK